MEPRMRQHARYHKRSRQPVDIQPDELVHTQSRRGKRPVADMKAEQQHEPGREGSQRGGQKAPVQEKIQVTSLHGELYPTCLLAYPMYEASR